jgi:hypothetical protein
MVTTVNFSARLGRIALHADEEEDPIPCKRRSVSFWGDSAKTDD